MEIGLCDGEASRPSQSVSHRRTTAAVGVGGGAPTRRTSASRLGQARHRFQWRCACPPNAGTATSRLLRFFHLHLRRPPQPRSRSQIRLPAARRHRPKSSCCSPAWIQHPEFRALRRPPTIILARPTVHLVRPWFRAASSSVPVGCTRPCTHSTSCN